MAPIINNLRPEHNGMKQPTAGPQTAITSSVVAHGTSRALAELVEHALQIVGLDEGDVLQLHRPREQV